jgi:rhodanese-related sulfurtransferase
MCRDDASRQVMITGAINLPAQTFYPLLPMLTSILGKIPIVIFHCSSSQGRATRCAGWLQDTLPPGSQCKVFILDGGMKAWRARFGEDAKMIIEMPAEEGGSAGTRT